MRCGCSAGEGAAYSPGTQGLFSNIAHSLLERVEHCVVLTNGQCEVLYKNKAARILLRAGRGVTLQQQRLSFLTHKNEPLTTLVESLASSDSQEVIP